MGRVLCPIFAAINSGARVRRSRAVRFSGCPIRRCRHLRSFTEAATRKSDLDAVEDEIDAIFCAYLSYHWATEPDRLMVLGDVSNGYVVTPAPAATTATKRPGRIDQVRPPEALTEGEDQLRAAFRQAVPRLTDQEVEALVQAAIEAGVRPLA